jgi:hypothetical protein
MPVPEQPADQQEYQQDEEQGEDEPEGEKAPAVVSVSPLVESASGSVPVDARVEPGLKGTEAHEQRDDQDQKDHQNHVPPAHQMPP